MANDTPFIDATNRSPQQGTGDRLVRGDDHAVLFSDDSYYDAYGTDYTGVVQDDEYARAIAYAAHIKLQAQGRLRLLQQLKGNPAARTSIQAKTQALARSATPHIVDPAGDDHAGGTPRGKALV